MSARMHRDIKALKAALRALLECHDGKCGASPGVPCPAVVEAWRLLRAADTIATRAR